MDSKKAKKSLSLMTANTSHPIHQMVLKQHPLMYLKMSSPFQQLVQAQQTKKASCRVYLLGVVSQARLVQTKTALL